MKFKKGIKIETDSFWYDLFEGGYIDPSDILPKGEDLEKVKEAIKVLENFFDELTEQDKIVIL